MFNRISQNPEEVKEALKLFTYTDENGGQRRLSDILTKARLAWELNLPPDSLSEEEAKSARIALAKLIAVKRVLDRAGMWKATLKFLQNGGEIDVSKAHDLLLANRFWAKLDKIAKAYGFECDCDYYPPGDKTDLKLATLEPPILISKRAHAGVFTITLEGKEASVSSLEIEGKLAEVFKEFEETLKALEEELNNQNALSP